MIPVLANCWFIEFSLRKVRYTVTSEDVYDFSDTRIIEIKNGKVA